jgi:hypothetical protein
MLRVASTLINDHRVVFARVDRFVNCGWLIGPGLICELDSHTLIGNNQNRCAPPRLTNSSGIALGLRDLRPGFCGGVCELEGRRMFKVRVISCLCFLTCCSHDPESKP